MRDFLALKGCRVYVHDVASATGMRLHPHYTPCEWEHQQHAVEVWLSRALSHSPWRTASPRDADFVYLDGHGLSKWCTASRTLYIRNQKGNKTGDERVCQTGSNSSAKDVAGATSFHALQAFRWTGKGEGVLTYRDQRSKMLFWQRMLETSNVTTHRAVPRLIALTSFECERPFKDHHMLPRDLIMLPDRVSLA